MSRLDIRMVRCLTEPRLRAALAQPGVSRRVRVVIERRLRAIDAAKKWGSVSESPGRLVTFDERRPA